MSTNDITNLDSLCAECGYNIVYDVAPTLSLPKGESAKLENTITKSLGVLQEHGVYAFFLFLDVRNSEKGANKIRKRTMDLLRDSRIALLPAIRSQDDYLKLKRLTEDLDDLLLTRQLLEQTLIYARYHAKALKEED